MLRRYKLIILISVMILVPILIGMVPLNMAHKLGSVGHFAHGNQCLNNHCPFNSLASYNDHAAETLESTPFGHNSHASQEVGIPILDASPYGTVFTSTPLRC